VVVLFTLVSLPFAFGFDILLSLWPNLTLATLILGTIPGGVAEMTRTAKVRQLDPHTVTTFPVMRMAFVVIVTGFIGQDLAKRRIAKITVMLYKDTFKPG
jgi:uncharacterized protein